MRQSNAGTAGGSDGALGGASQADLDRGYTKLNDLDNDLARDRMEDGSIDDDTGPAADQGFLDRPGQHKFDNWY